MPRRLSAASSRAGSCFAHLLTVGEDDHPQKPGLKPVAGACLTPLTLVSSVSHGTATRELPCRISDRFPKEGRPVNRSQSAGASCWHLVSHFGDQMGCGPKSSTAGNPRGNEPRGCYSVRLNSREAIRKTYEQCPFPAARRTPFTPWKPFRDTEWGRGRSRPPPEQSLCMRPPFSAQHLYHVENEIVDLDFGFATCKPRPDQNPFKVSRTRMRARPSQFVPRQFFGSMIRGSSHARPTPQILS